MEVKSGHALLEVLNFAAGQRVICSTLKNTDSSRSHAFYRLYMQPRKGVRLFVQPLQGSSRTCKYAIISIWLQGSKTARNILS